VTWSEGPRASPLDHAVRILEQRLDKQLERLGDDDRNGRGHLAHVLVALHDLLDAGLKKERMKLRERM
jgi:hypothetical protein